MRDPLLLKQLLLNMSGTTDLLPLSAAVVDELQPYMVCLGVCGCVEG